MPDDNKIYAVEEVEDLLAEFNSPKNRLTVFKPFVRYFGDLNTAIILSEIFTWSYHFRDRKLPGIGYGWFYRQYEPSCKQQELDGISGVEVAVDEMNETTGRGAEGKTWLERVGLREDVVRKIDLPPELWTVRKAATTEHGGLSWYQGENVLPASSKLKRSS